MEKVVTMVKNDIKTLLSGAELGNQEVRFVFYHNIWNIVGADLGRLLCWTGSMSNMIKNKCTCAFKLPLKKVDNCAVVDHIVIPINNLDYLFDTMFQTTQMLARQRTPLVKTWLFTHAMQNLTQAALYRQNKQFKESVEEELRKEQQEQQPQPQQEQTLSTPQQQPQANSSTSIMRIFDNIELNAKVRMVMLEGEPWFVGKDVAECLGYSRARDAISDHVENDDKLTRCFDASGQNRNMTVINESGLYSLIFSSKLPSAKQFKSWVTKEVLPSIRKHGVYSVSETYTRETSELLQSPDTIITICNNWKADRQKLEEAKSELDNLKEKVKELASSLL